MAAFPPPVNGVIQLQADTYTIPSRVSIPANVKVKGPASGKALLTAPNVSGTPDGELLYVQGNNVQITGSIEFRWGGIYRDGRVTGLLIDGPSFIDINPTGNNPGGQNKHKAAITSYESTGLTVRNCYFEDVDYVTWLANEKNVEVHNNEWAKVRYGCKVFGDGANDQWHAWDNYIHDCGPDFMGFEWQGRCANWTLEGNFAERITVGPTKESNDHTLFFSLPMAKSDGDDDPEADGIVRQNVFIGTPPNPNGIHIPMCFEVGGGVKGNINRSILYEQNYVNGCNNSFDVTDRDATARIRFRNNYAINVNKVINSNASTQEIIREGENGTNAPPPSGLASWDAFVAFRRTKVGRSGATIPPVDPPTDPVDPHAQCKKDLEASQQATTAAVNAANSYKAQLDAANAKITEKDNYIAGYPK